MFRPQTTRCLPIWRSPSRVDHITRSTYRLLPRSASSGPNATSYNTENRMQKRQKNIITSTKSRETPGSKGEWKHSAFYQSEEVRSAKKARKPIVALETTIYTHGFPFPENVDLALGLEKVVRDNGGVPATIGVIDGQIRVGMTTEELTYLASSAGKPETMKVSRRDIPYIVGLVSRQW
jgi:pseudouridine-5'-phosphate glycosidase/pseudouridine kinase